MRSRWVDTSIVPELEADLKRMGLLRWQVLATISQLYGRREKVRLFEHVDQPWAMTRPRVAIHEGSIHIDTNFFAHRSRHHWRTLLARKVPPDQPVLHPYQRPLSKD